MSDVVELLDGSCSNIEEESESTFVVSVTRTLKKDVGEMERSSNPSMLGFDKENDESKIFEGLFLSVLFTCKIFWRSRLGVEGGEGIETA